MPPRSGDPPLRTPPPPPAKVGRCSFNLLGVASPARSSRLLPRRSPPIGVSGEWVTQGGGRPGHTLWPVPTSRSLFLQAAAVLSRDSGPARGSHRRGTQQVGLQRAAPGGCGPKLVRMPGGREWGRRRTVPRPRWQLAAGGRCTGQVSARGSGGPGGCGRQVRRRGSPRAPRRGGEGAPS